MEKCPVDDLDNPPWRWREVRLYVEVSLDHTVELTAKVCKSHTARQLQAFAERWVEGHLAEVTGDAGVAA